jgi:hypothetical protein
MLTVYLQPKVMMSYLTKQANARLKVMATSQPTMRALFIFLQIRLIYKALIAILKNMPLHIAAFVPMGFLLAKSLLVIQRCGASLTARSI